MSGCSPKAGDGVVALAQGARDGARRAERIRSGEVAGWGEWEELVRFRSNPTCDYELGFLLGAEAEIAEDAR